METPAQPHDDDGFRELRVDDPVERAAAAATLGLRGHGPAGLEVLAGLVAGDPDARVRAAALGALIRTDALSATTLEAWQHGWLDADPGVRRRACELAPRLRSDAGVADELVGALNDPAVAEVACWALGELGDDAIAAGAVTALADTASGNADPLVRESAVAALGALGDPAGLPAILAATADKPAIRRRAVLALAPFTGPDVDAAIDRALTDKDWQVRQVAEDLRTAER